MVAGLAAAQPGVRVPAARRLRVPRLRDAPRRPPRAPRLQRRRHRRPARRPLPSVLAARGAAAAAAQFGRAQFGRAQIRATRNSAAGNSAFTSSSSSAGGRHLRRPRHRAERAAPHLRASQRVGGRRRVVGLFVPRVRAAPPDHRRAGEARHRGGAAPVADGRRPPPVPVHRLGRLRPPHHRTDDVRCPPRDDSRRNSLRRPMPSVTCAGTTVRSSPSRSAPAATPRSSWAARCGGRARMGH